MILESIKMSNTSPNERGVRRSMDLFMTTAETETNHQSASNVTRINIDGAVKKVAKERPYLES